MALTTRSAVMTRLGLTDDAAAEPAILVAINRATLTSCTFVISGTTLAVTPTPGSPTNYDLTAAAYDTTSELATALNALSGVDSSVIGSSVSSSLLTSPQNISLDNTLVADKLTYTNTAAGTNAALIDDLIERVDHAIARYCNRANESTGEEEFSSGSRDEYYDGSGQSVLNLRCWPVSSITSVATIDTSGNSTTLSSSDYRVDGRTGRLWYKASGLALARGGVDQDGFGFADSPAYGVEKYGWPYGFKNIRVQYVGGYSTIPLDLNGVAIDMVCDLFLNRRANARLSGESMSGRNISYRTIDDLLKQHHAALAPYRSMAHD